MKKRLLILLITCISISANSFDNEKVGKDLIAAGTLLGAGIILPIITTAVIMHTSDQDNIKTTKGIAITSYTLSVCFSLGGTFKLISAGNKMIKEKSYQKPAIQKNTLPLEKRQQYLEEAIQTNLPKFSNENKTISETIISAIIENDLEKIEELKELHPYSNWTIQQIYFNLKEIYGLK